MKIAIDARDILRRPTGVVAYTVNLIRGLARCDWVNDYRLYIDSYRDAEIGESNLVDQVNVSVRSLPSSGLLWKQVLLPMTLRRDAVDVFHSPTSTVPLIRRPGTVVTFHDLFHEIDPEWTTPKIRRRLGWLYRYAAAASGRVIAVSENTKRDLIRLYDVDPDKITVVYSGTDEFFKRIDRAEAADAAAALGIDGPYILHVGALAKWRNVPRLLEAFSACRRAGVTHKLVLVGREFWGFSLGDMIADTDLADSIVSLPYVSMEHLRALYNAADLLLFPSLYEGFGLPVLEAMACGTPVVASNTSALPEAVGNAGVLVDPYDAQAIAAGVLRVLGDTDLQADLTGKGLVRAREFSWDRCAKATLYVYESAAQI